MTRYLIKRAGGAVAVVIALLVFTFLATYMIGDPVGLLVDPELSSDEEIAAIRAAAGLDEPLPVQFYEFTGRVIRGDFGTSLFHHRPARDLVFDRLPATFRLALLTVSVALVVSVSLAVIATWQKGKWIERVILLTSTALVCIPSFWLALVLILIFAVNLAWLPTSGTGGPRYFIMPIIALSALPIGHLTQVLHTGLVNEFLQPYVGVARAKGLTERTLLTRHVLRNSLVLLMTLIGSMLAALLNGAVLVEAIFAWPGIGDLGLQAVRQRDLPVLTAVVFYAGISVTLINFLVDVIYTRVDPRVRLP